MNRRGSSRQHASNCSRVTNIVQDSTSALPLPRFVLPTATPVSTLAKLVRPGLSNCVVLAGRALELLRVIARGNMIRSSSSDGVCNKPVRRVISKLRVA